MNKILPNGNSRGVPVKSTDELGLLIRAARKAQGLTQLDVAGLGNTGNRVIVDIENGKPTVQLIKVMDLMDLLGLQLVVRKKGEQ
jgi:y4mF family transcriptional regulator